MAATFKPNCRKCISDMVNIEHRYRRWMKNINIHHHLFPTLFHIQQRNGENRIISFSVRALVLISLTELCARHCVMSCHVICFSYIVYII